jgi:hypothetical protein
MRKAIKLVLIVVGALFVAVALLVVGSAIVGNGDYGNPVSTTKIDGKTVKIYTPGDNPSLNISSAAEGAQEIEVRGKVIAIGSDAVITVDGKPLSVGDFTELALVVHADGRVESHIVKPAQ